VSSDASDPRTAEETASLGAPLAEPQLDLLEQIWSPCSQGFGWPVWDYVARKLFRRANPILEPGKLLVSLPRVPSTQFSEYGLIWRSELSPLEPRPDQQVGLTIAGLHALRGRDVRAGMLADALTAAIRDLAALERQLEPEVGREVTLKHDLVPLLQDWTASSGVRGRDFLDVLQREWAPVNLQRGEGDRATVTLRMYLAPFHQIHDASAYVRFVSQQVMKRPRPIETSPLMIAQMLDYLSLTLAADPRWDGGPLVTKPNLRSAGVIALPATSDVEFRDRLSALAILLETLSVPTADNSEEARQQKSLGRLAAWLTTRFDDAAVQANVLSAISDLRAVVQLRVEGQHTGSRPQAQAAAARVRLGLPDVIFDWSDAWQIVRGRVVEALEQISREVRAAT
jgi:hypothetical protein